MAYTAQLDPWPFSYGTWWWVNGWSGDFSGYIDLKGYTAGTAGEIVSLGLSAQGGERSDRSKLGSEPAIQVFFHVFLWFSMFFHVFFNVFSSVPTLLWICLLPFATIPIDFPFPIFGTPRIRKQCSSCSAHFNDLQWSYPKMDGLSWKILVEWMIEGYPVSPF